MPVPSPILASLSPALRSLEAAAARAPELTPEQEAALSTLLAETVEKLDELAARLELARTPRDGYLGPCQARVVLAARWRHVGGPGHPPDHEVHHEQGGDLKRHITTIIVVALSIAMFLALSGTVLAGFRFP